MSVTTTVTGRISRDAQIYTAYIESKNNKTGMDAVCKKFGLSRQGVYDAIKRVKSGNHRMILKALAEARNEILWTYKYQAMYEVLPKNRKPGTIEELTAMVKSMYTDGFPETLIAKKLRMVRNTVRHHLNK